jgi:hypothetical protein
MAQQCGILTITGTIGAICFYRMADQYYARQKSSLDGKRVKKDPAFKETMRYAGLMAEASVTASAFYRLLPVEKRKRRNFQLLTGKVLQLLKEDHPTPALQAALIDFVEKEL